MSFQHHPSSAADSSRNPPPMPPAPVPNTSEELYKGEPWKSTTYGALVALTAFITTWAAWLADLYLLPGGRITVVISGFFLCAWFFVMAVARNIEETREKK